MKILLIDNGTTLLDKLKNLIPGDETIERFDVFRKEEAKNFDLIILSGGSLFQLPGNEDKFSEEIAYIKTTQKPLIGICFGYELIVEAFGGTLKKLDIADHGIKEVEIIDKDLYEKPSVNVYENHEWIIDTIPENFEVLGQSKNGPEIIKHKKLPVYGFQFHPENFVDTTEGDEIFLKLLSSFLSITY